MDSPRDVHQLTMSVRKTNQPNLLLIGAPRCASTAFAAAMSQHPDIYVCEPKEPHFLGLWGSERNFQGVGAEAFGKNRIYDHQQWEKLFLNRSERYCVDASVSTISYPEISIPNIKQFCTADTKIIAILRNPVERAFSSYMYCLSRGWEAGSFEESLSDEKQRIESNWQHLWFLKYLSEYELRLKPFFEAFPRQNIHIVITEEFSATPDAVLNELFQFLDLQAVKIDTSLRFNSSGKPNSILLRDMAAYVRSKPLLRDLLRRVSTTRFREFVKSGNLTKVEMNSDTSEMLNDSLEGTKTWVEELLGRPVPSWK